MKQEVKKEVKLLKRKKEKMGEGENTEGLE